MLPVFAKPAQIVCQDVAIPRRRPVVAFIVPAVRQVPLELVEFLLHSRHAVLVTLVRGLGILTLLGCGLSSYGQPTISSVTSSVPSAPPLTSVTFSLSVNDTHGSVTQLYLLIDFWIDATDACYVTYKPGSPRCCRNARLHILLGTYLWTFSTSPLSTLRILSLSVTLQITIRSTSSSEISSPRRS